MATTALQGLHVLEALAGMRQPASLRAVADRVGLSESYTYRLLRALEDEGYLHHLGRAGYRLASRSVALAAVIGPRPAMRRVMYPVAARLVATTGQAVVVHLRAGDARVLVLGVPSPAGPVVDPADVLGERSPLTSGASGRVILAHLPNDELKGLALDGFDAKTLADIRNRGYDMSFEENHPGINGISAPLLAAHDDPAAPPTALGSMTIAGPAESMTAQTMMRLAAPLQGACRDLGPRLAALLGPNPGVMVRALDL